MLGRTIASTMRSVSIRVRWAREILEGTLATSALVAAIPSPCARVSNPTTTCADPEPSRVPFPEHAREEQVLAARCSIRPECLEASKFSPVVHKTQRVEVLVVEQKTCIAPPFCRECIRVKINTAYLRRADPLPSSNPTSIATDRVTVDCISTKISEGDIRERVEGEMGELGERPHHLDDLCADLLQLTYHFQCSLLP